MALSQRSLKTRVHAAQRRRFTSVAPPARHISRRAMSLESIESNEYSVRFKVLEEVPLTAVVEHILTNADGALPDNDAATGRARALELLQIGSVYVGFPQKGLDFINWVRSSDLPVAVTAATVPAGQYVRVHPHPKRYPACYCKDWPDRVLHCDQDYVVVNKPAGLPCMRHESNAVEELASCVGRALGMEGVEVCHRLDQWTTGIVVLSRNKEANKAFKRALQDREAGLTKTYKALSYSPVPLGPMEHHMYDGPFNENAPVLGGGNLRPRGPRLLSHTAHQRWRVCRLEVKECKEHSGALSWYEKTFGSLPHDGAFVAAPRALELYGSRQQLDPLAAGAVARLETTGASCEPGPGQDPSAQSRQAHLSEQDDTKREQNSPPSLEWLRISQEKEPQPARALRSQDPMAEEAHPRPLRLYESTIVLHTGRTHQIRAQLASVGCPLVGDVMYAPITGLLVDESGVLRDPSAVALVEQLPMLDRHIGLHAWRLTWRDRVFEAAPDWGPE